MMWLGVFTVFLQVGQASWEAGKVAAKNAEHVGYKNLLLAGIAMIGWWILGYGMQHGKAEGTNSFFGGDKYLVREKDMNGNEAQFWTGWAATSFVAAIVSSAVAGRAKFEGQMIWTFLMAALVLPIVGHWSAGGGWLVEQDYSDAGAGRVHYAAGVMSLVAAHAVGARKDSTGGNNQGTIGMGILCFWVGWHGFWAGDAQTVMNGSMVASFAGFSTLVVDWFMNGKKWDLSTFGHGFYAGLIVSTGGCKHFETHNSMIVGLLVPFWMIVGNFIVAKLKVDDACEAFVYHGMGGFWGLLAVGIFDGHKGFLCNGKIGEAFWGNIIGWIVTTLWCAVVTFAVWFTLGKLNMARVSDDEEEAGMDALVGKNSKTQVAGDE